MGGHGDPASSVRSPASSIGIWHTGVPHVLYHLRTPPSEPEELPPDELPELEDDEAPELEEDEEAPELDEDAPELDDDAPELDDEAPELDDDAPELDDDAPELDDDAPELDDEAVPSHRPVTTVSHPSPHVTDEAQPIPGL
jgi:hypothetical protein